MPSEPCVFVVDDDAAMLDSMSSLLRSQGLPTECFSSAEHFYQEVDASRAGCLVADLRMPGMTGVQLLQRLTEEGASRPVVVVTGFAEIEAAVQSMKLGAIDVLLKPFAPSILLDAVRDALELDRAIGWSANSVERRCGGSRR